MRYMRKRAYIKQQLAEIDVVLKALTALQGRSHPPSGLERKCCSHRQQGRRETEECAHLRLIEFRAGR